MRGDECEVIVVGGGLVGAALGYGLARRGLRVAVLDGDDRGPRASRANFGLVWVQGKGDGCPAYAAWTRRSADRWPAFAEALEEATGIDVAYRRPGGVHLCFDEAELASRREQIERMARAAGGVGYDCELLEHGALKRLLPLLGERVAGGSYCRHDGHANPLRLLRALHAGLEQAGGTYLSGHPVERVVPLGTGFEVRTPRRRLVASKVVLAAGLGNPAIASGLGLHVPVQPERGQILVTERVQPAFEHPLSTLRQTDEGTLLLGDSQEPVGFDDGTTLRTFHDIARRAVTAFPALARVKVVRGWGGLRVLSPDGFPIYEESSTHPGAFVATCHSGVTLAAVHAGVLADWIGGGEAPRELEAFSSRRFDAQTTARRAQSDDRARRRAH